MKQALELLTKGKIGPLELIGVTWKPRIRFLGFELREAHCVARVENDRGEYLAERFLKGIGNTPLAAVENAIAGSVKAIWPTP